MPKRLTINDVKNRLIGSDLNCLDMIYRNPRLKMKFECSQGHNLKLSWGETQNLIKRNSPHCPICRSGEIQLSSDTNKKKVYTSSDGEVFERRKDQIDHDRKLRAQNVPHEIAVESICSSFKHAQKYKFRKNVIETVAKWDLITKLAEQKEIESTDIKILKKDIHKSFCSICEGNPNQCQCNEGSYTHYNFTKEELGKYIEFIPDVYVINEEMFTISAIEVEDTHRIPIAKLLQYAIFADCLDWWFPYWNFELLIYDRFGNKMGAINLPVYYLSYFEKGLQKNYVQILERCEQSCPRIEDELIGYFRTAKLAKY